MDYETSAGGVIVNEEHTKILLLRDKTGNLSFPKGLIEPGEERVRAAEREIGEEVGIKRLRLLGALNPIEYFYKWEGQLRKKTVYYFLFAGDENETPTPQLEEGITEVKWFPLGEAKEIIGYKKTNAKVLEEVEEKLHGLLS